MQQALDLGSDAERTQRDRREDSPLPRFRDSAFEGNKIASIHRWVPWIAGFSANFVRDTFEHYLPQHARRKTILEPFAGVGTTLVEGIAHGCDVVGFEVNPFAYLASRVKCNAHAIAPAEIDRALSMFAASAVPKCAAVDGGLGAIDRPGSELHTAPAPISQRPPKFKSRVPFFSPVIEIKVLYCLDAIREIPDATVRDLFLLALGAILVSISNYSYEPSLGSRVAAGRAPVDNDDVAGRMIAKIRSMRDDIAEYVEVVCRFADPPSSAIYNDSSLRIDQLLEPRTVDLVVTSPPYLNNYHYIRNTRPQLYWLDFVASSADLKQIENDMFGKFWQTVRDRPPMGLEFELPSLTSLIGAIANRNRDRKVYGGQGWANYASQYFNDSYRICGQLRYVLRPGAHAVFVLGNSIIQGVEIPVDRIFGQIAELNGLELADIHLLRTKRVGNSTVKSAARYGEADGASLYETAVVLRQPVE